MIPSADFAHPLHLSEDQIDDALVGDLAAEGSAHLATCAACRLRLAEAEAPLAAFNAVSLAWSERRSATMPRLDLSAAVPWLPRALWGATAAAILAVGIAIPAVRHAKHENAVAPQSESSAATLLASDRPMENPVAARDEQIANDNQMLADIDRELHAPSASTFREYGFQAGSKDMAPRSSSMPIRN